MTEKILEKKPIPITLLSGFLGLGKTTLLERILTSNHGMKVAVIINDMSLINIDAALIKDHNVSRTEEKLVKMQNGCICCTLRGDLLEELINLVDNKDIEYIIIESTGISEPMQVAETFSVEFTETLLDTYPTITTDLNTLFRKVINRGGLNKIANLDTCVTVIDAMNFMSNVDSTKFLVDRWGDSGQGELERTITDLMIDQIEFADVIILNKISTVGKKKIHSIIKNIKILNPVAKILKCNYCNIDLKNVLNTKLFDFEKASASAGWLHSLNEMTPRVIGDDRQVLAPKPETEEYGVNNFVYRARRPFHPERLYHLIRDKFILIEQTPIANEEYQESEEDEGDDEGEEEEDEEEEDNDEDEEEEDKVDEKEIVKNKKESFFGPMLRSKGFIWLATRYIMRGEWSSAGPMLTMKGGIPWFAITGIEGIPAEAAQLIKADMEGKHGDRRNEIVMIGINIDRPKITQAFDECLLTDAEFQKYEEIVLSEKNLLKVDRELQRTFDDGFQDWIIYDEEDADEEKEAAEDDEESRSDSKSPLRNKAEHTHDKTHSDHGKHAHSHHPLVRSTAIKISGN